MLIEKDLKKMLSKKQTDYYLFQIIFIYRRTIPSNDLFYFVFFFLKFIGVFLLVHNIKGLEDNVYSFESIFRYFTLKSNSMSFLFPNYLYISIGIFSFLLLFIIVVTIIICTHRNSKQRFNIALLNSNKSGLTLSLRMQKTVKCISIIFLVICFISHFISEFLILSFILCFHAKENHDTNESDPKKAELETFVTQMNKYKYAIVFINCISLIVLIIFDILFLLLSTALSLERTYGFTTNIDLLGIILLLGVFRCQGVYTISWYFVDSNGDIRFWICCIAVSIILFGFLINLKQYNHSKDVITYSINFTINWCLIGGILEMVLSKTLRRNLSQMESLSKDVFEIINAAFVTILITRIKHNMQLRKFVNNAFNEHNKVQEYNSLEEYSYILSNHLFSKIDFIQMHQLFEDHRLKCSNDQCKCHKMNSQFQKKLKSKTRKKDSINVIKKAFIEIGESEIVSLINTCKDQNSNGEILKKLYFLHVDYVKTIKSKYFLALYLAKWYQECKSNYFNIIDYYFLYEIEEDIIQMFNDKKDSHSLKKAERIGVNGNIKLTIKNGYKQKILLNNSLFCEKLTLQIYNCLTEMERFAYYRNIVRMNVKTTIQCKEFLNPIVLFMKDYREIIKILDNYFDYNKEIPCGFIELSYVLNYFFILFKGNIPLAYRNKFTHFPKYSDYIINNSLATKYMILLLTNDDTIELKAISIQLAEDLSFSKEDIINKDIHDTLIPSHLTQYHFIYMKSFILNGESNFSKITYLINKDKCIIPFKLSGKVLPTISKHLSLIIKAAVYHHLETKKNKAKDDLQESTYYLCLDYYFNLLAVSENFTKNFIFSLNMFKTLKLNFCSFFGVKQEQVADYFNKKIKKKSHILGKELKNSILTTIPHEKKQLYQNVLNYYQKNKKCEEKEFQIDKARSVLFIKRLEKNIDELGLEKEWNEKITDLCDRLGNGNKDTHFSNSMTHFSYAQENKNNKLNFLFKLRNIGNLYYYIVIFHNKMPESTLFKSEQNETLNKELIGTSISVRKTYLSNIDDKQLYMNMNINSTSKESSYFDLHSKKELNQSSNNSKAFILSNIRLNQGFDSGLIKNTYKDSRISYRKMSRIKNKADILKKILLLILLLLVVFHIVSFTVNYSFVSLFVNMFYINSNAFLLSGDIFFTALGCLRACLIQEKMQTGSITEIETSIEYHSHQMMEHFQLMLKLIHKMARESESTAIYEILIEEKDYTILLANWETTTRRSNFWEELFYYHYYLANFDLSDQKSCKLNTFFEIRELSQRTDEATLEEKTIHYIIMNIISKISTSLHKLTQISDNQLSKYTEIVKINMISFNGVIFVLGISLYSILMGYISLLKKINEIIMTQFFSKVKGEDEFNADVERLKRVILHFNKKECNQFEETKGKSNPYLLKGTEITPYNSPNIKQKNSITNNQTSTLGINQLSKMKINNSSKLSRLKIADHPHQKKNNQAETELLDQYKNTINKLSKMRFMNGLLFCIVLLFTIFSGIQISNILILKENSEAKIIENIVSTFFLLRIPKFSELVLYTEISVILNDLNSVIPNPNENSVENYYDIKVNDNNNSFINTLKNKNFIHLYNQLDIVRQNLHYFINEKNTNAMLPFVQKIERNFQSNEFCQELSRVYSITLFDNKISSLVNYFKMVSSEGRKCRVFGSGINLSGLKVVFDLLIQHLYVLYVEFETTDRNELAQKDFLQDDLLVLIIDSLQSTMGNVHKSFAYFTLNDVIDSYYLRYKKEITISIISVIVSTGIFSLLLIFIIKAFESHNSVLESFWLKIDKAIMLKQMNKIISI